MRTTSLKFPFTLASALVLGSAASGQKLTALPAPNGIWITLQQNTAPANALLQRKSGGQETTLTTLEGPSSYENFAAGYYRGLASDGAAFRTYEDSTLQRIYSRWERWHRLDSLGYYAIEKPILSGLGLAWFDSEAPANTTVQYSVTDGGRTIESGRVSFPPEPATVGKFLPAYVRPTTDGVLVAFKVADVGNTYTAHVYRAYYMRSDYRRVNVEGTFTDNEAGKWFSFVDKTAEPKVGYSYIVRPVDAGGNEGAASQPANLFNVAAESIMPSVRGLRARSAEKENAIVVSWDPPDGADVTSVEVYRSTERTGAYSRLASLSPRVTEFKDFTADPIVTYWYTVALNGTFEESVNSMRVPGTMRANKQNLIPPSGLVAGRVPGTNVVRLEWFGTPDATRGYYLYRANGYRGTFRKISALIYPGNDSSLIRATDTIGPEARNKTFTYAVSDENSSYAESPLSGPSSVTLYAEGATDVLPVSHLRAALNEGGLSASISWRPHDEAVNGYLVYRAELDAAGKPGEAALLTKTPVLRSLFSDGSIIAGKSYSYAVALADPAGKPFKQGTPVMLDIPDASPMNVNDIAVFSTSGSNQLRWTNPLGAKEGGKIYILRREFKGQVKTLATLPENTTEYTDSDIKSGNSYDYYFVVEDGAGRKSEPTLPVSVQAE